MQSQVACSFCGEDIKERDAHPCAWEAFQLLNTISKPKEEQTLFNDIDNLVFQGGGVKGISYLGVLNKLKDPKFKPNNFLENVKRVAGTSAGSLMALYLALRLDEDTVKKEVIDENGKKSEVEETMIADYLSRDYATLLDTDSTLTVNGTKYSRKQVVLSLVAKIDSIKTKIKADCKDVMLEKELNTMVRNIVSYLAQDYGLIARLIALKERKSIAELVVEWLIKSLTPTDDETQRHADWSKELFNEQPSQQVETDTTETNAAKFREILQHSVEEAIEHANEEPAAPVPAASQENEEKKESEQPGSQKSEKSPQEQKDSFVLLDGDKLDFAVGELIKYVMKGRESNVGLFSGKTVLNELILKPIKDKLAKYPHIHETDPTFKQLASYTKEGTDIKIFRELYVTAFNVQLGRTEVFSALHSPNVKVSEAIRASISIPVFFEPVKIKENGKPRLIYQEVNSTKSNNGSTEKKLQALEVDYMDGGVLDNYPIWIFDDLRYCLSTKPKKLSSEIRIPIQNPRTLGFRILDESTLKVYVRPYFDPERTKKKIVENQDYKNTFSYFLPQVMSGISGHEENVFMNDANWPRSVYVNNLGVSSVAFNLSKEQKKLLIQEGEKAIELYKLRAQYGNFLKEGQTYPTDKEEVEEENGQVKEEERGLINTGKAMFRGIYNYFSGHKSDEK